MQATHVEDSEPTDEGALILAFGLVLAGVYTIVPFTFIPLAISRNWQTNLSILKKSRGRQGLEDPAPTLRSAIDRIFHYYRAKLGGDSRMPAERFSVQWLHPPSPSLPSPHRLPSRRLYRKQNLWWTL